MKDRRQSLTGDVHLEPKALFALDRLGEDRARTLTKLIYEATIADEANRMWELGVRYGRHFFYGAITSEFRGSILTDTTITGCIIHDGVRMKATVALDEFAQSIEDIDTGKPFKLFARSDLLQAYQAKPGPVTVTKEEMRAVRQKLYS